MTFDFDAITVGELDEALSGSKYSDGVRKVLAKITGQTFEQISGMKRSAYLKLVAAFVMEAYSPVETDPN